MCQTKRVPTTQPATIMKASQDSRNLPTGLIFPLLLASSHQHVKCAKTSLSAAIDAQPLFTIYSFKFGVEVTFAFPSGLCLRGQTMLSVDSF